MGLRSFIADHVQFARELRHIDFDHAHLAKRRGRYKLHMTASLTIATVFGVIGPLYSLDWANHVSLYANAYTGMLAVWE